MGVCCVEGCEVDDKEDVTYFPFPIKPALRRKWREAIRTSSKLHDDSKVCSKHFNSTDYEQVRGKLRLKGRVVPSIFHYVKKEQPRPKSPSRSPTPSKSPSSIQNNCDPMDFQLQERQTLEHTDDSTENCTIECVPEAILNHETDSTSENELEKAGDIEDIIANYHIKQNKKLAERLKAEAESIDREKGKEDKSHSQDGVDGTRNGGGQDGGKCKNGGKNGDNDCVEVRQTIEISVDKVNSRSGRNSPADCMMVLENVQVDIDPSSLMLSEEPEEENEKGDPISLLTSSDDDDVILEEPHIDTVEVSSETDEDDQPLVRLVKDKKPKKQNEILRKLLWSAQGYSCYECKFTTNSSVEYKTHKAQHDKIIYVCDLCNFTSASKGTFSRHKRIHKMEKKFKCHLCEYKARHNMSLIYHMKSHEGVSADDVRVLPKFTVKNSYKCSDCHFQTESKKMMLKHVKTCSTVRKKTIHKCDSCSYITKRRSDLKRHFARKHTEFDIDDVDYVPK